MGKRKTKAPGQCIAKAPDPDTGRMKRCTNPAHCKGLCKRDYWSTWADVTAGNTTWEQLEAEGKALPSKITLSTYTIAKRSRKRRAVS